MKVEDQVQGHPEQHNKTLCQNSSARATLQWQSICPQDMRLGFNLLQYAHSQKDGKEKWNRERKTEKQQMNIKIPKTMK